MSKSLSRAATIAAAVSACAPLTMQFEGLVTHPNRDPVGVEEVCYGETSVVMHTYTKAQCGAFLRERQRKDFAPIVLNVVPRLKGPPLAAAIDFAYNHGSFKNTEMARRFKAGDIENGCYAFGLYQFRGLIGIAKRRFYETALCLGQQSSTTTASHTAAR